MVENDKDTAQGQQEATGSTKTGKKKVTQIKADELFTPEIYRLLEKMIKEL